MTTQDDKVLADTTGIQTFLSKCKNSLSEEKFSAVRQTHFEPWSIICSMILHFVSLGDAVFMGLGFMICHVFCCGRPAGQAGLGRAFNIFEADRTVARGSMDCRPERVLGSLPGNNCILYINRTID